jgi:hypothetical protein
MDVAALTSVQRRLRYLGAPFSVASPFLVFTVAVHGIATDGRP